MARASEARDVLPDALRARGAEVDVLALYETRRRAALERARLEQARAADYITFTSSSTVRFFFEARAGEDGRAREHSGHFLRPPTRIVSIGPVTSATLREHGLEPHVEAQRHDIDGLVEALLAECRRARRVIGRGRRPRTAQASTIGHPRLHLRRTDSTNERARALAIEGAPHGTLVTAAEQTAGRGRQGRSLGGTAGSALLCSLVLRDPPPLLSLLAGVAVCDAVGARALVKWPNDIVVKGPVPQHGRDRRCVTRRALARRRRRVRARSPSSRASSWRGVPRKAGRCWGSA